MEEVVGSIPTRSTKSFNSNTSPVLNKQILLCVTFSRLTLISYASRIR
jgi:hypothetical protein